MSGARKAADASLASRSNMYSSSSSPSPSPAQEHVGSGCISEICISGDGEVDIFSVSFLKRHVRDRRLSVGASVLSDDATSNVLFMLLQFLLCLLTLSPSSSRVFQCLGSPS